MIDLLETGFYLSFFVGFLFGGMELYILHNEIKWGKR